MCSANVLIFELISTQFHFSCDVLPACPCFFSKEFVLRSKGNKFDIHWSRKYQDTGKPTKDA